MALEIKINDRTTTVEQISANGSKYVLKVGDKTYEVDAMMVEEGAYSFIHNNNSYNIEVIEGENNKNFQVNTFYGNFTVDIIDAERKYLMSRKSGAGDDEAHMKAPMPGKVVRVPVKVGDEVKAGDTVVVVSAMKMESEYKVKKDRVVKEVHVKEGDLVKGGQTMVVVE
ncbi:Glutaconyl-CoA decarboxylase subunit gamma [Salinivirga cyanobacteriivorans]|uniref:Glutaconyl-CoA decarboxylase subunit gamma n=1 Tax=Salinivirga cyanobacteriivorans TaxID=1307839 RepID=A0A0S2HY84_9BACT|nr:acetyl-CoA carboxylase biotin carboxyl carrier protein subunit [Salinivirga cyanobacteriivorans]ALO15018.1 Glutaconyl-CoA decarboxylase subunit gamma [Salinivirga cyanobacteriivorans]